jgi:hypothetical protein
MAVRHPGESPPEPVEGYSRYRRWVSVGLGVTVLAYALGAGVKMPHTLVLTIGVAGVTMIVVPFIPWRNLLYLTDRMVADRFNHVLENGRRQAASQARDIAAAQLDTLLTRHAARVWWGGRRLRWDPVVRWRLLADYHRFIKRAVLDAMNKARETEPVPPLIDQYAQKPRKLAELQSLRDWLRS